GEVLAVAAGQHQVRARLVEVLGEAQVLHVALAGPGPAAHLGRAGVADAPGPGQHVDLVLVDLVPRLALQVPDLDEHVHRLGAPTAGGGVPGGPEARSRRAAAAGLAWSTRARTSTTPGKSGAAPGRACPPPPRGAYGYRTSVPGAPEVSPSWAPRPR